MSGDKEAALVAALVEMKEEEALALARSLIAEGKPPALLLELSRKAMDEIGKRFEEGEYFLPELMMAGEMLAQIAELVKPLLAQSATGGERYRKADRPDRHGARRFTRYRQEHRGLHAGSKRL